VVSIQNFEKHWDVRYLQPRQIPYPAPYFAMQLTTQDLPSQEIWDAKAGDMVKYVLGFAVGRPYWVFGICVEC
jgi:hypothetical protein